MTHNLDDVWGVDFRPIFCDTCNWSFLIAENTSVDVCPNCHQATLEPFEEEAVLPPTQPPELVIPFTVTDNKLQKAVQEFADSFWFSPKDLTYSTLQNRLQRIFLPVWLVDSDVRGWWQAEIGFDYKVVSHQERFHQGKWLTYEHEETRIRWEQRVGDMTRRYDNVRAPALDEHDEIVTPLGRFKIWEPEPYAPELVEGAVVRFPNIDSADAWPEAEPIFMQRLEKDCQQASVGDHIRQFRWRPHFPNQNWSKLLLPIVTTYYLDDNQQPIPIVIHGLSAQLSGAKRGSMKLAQRLALILGAVAVVLFLIASLLLFTGVGSGVSLLTLLAVLVGVSALFPLIYVSQLNQS